MQLRNTGSEIKYTDRYLQSVLRTYWFTATLPNTSLVLQILLTSKQATGRLIHYDLVSLPTALWLVVFIINSSGKLRVF
jgi:hypothetical protein